MALLVHIASSTPELKTSNASYSLVGTKHQMSALNLTGTSPLSSANPQMAAEGTLKQFDSMMADPVACGYFRQFAKRNYCSENLDFFVAVQMYKDKHNMWSEIEESKKKLGESHSQRTASGNSNSLLSAYKVPTFAGVQALESENRGVGSNEDLSATGTNSVCSSLDDEFVETTDDVSNDALRLLAVAIHTKYVDDNSPEQVSLSANARFSLEKLLQEELTPIMPADGYDVALSEIKTSLKRDMFPRFEGCSEYMNCMSLQDIIAKPPPIEKNSPTMSLVDTNEITEDKDYQFSLREVLGDRHLYGVFHDYLMSRHCAENLLCWRYVQLYKMLYNRGTAVDREINVQRAWNIYALFLHPGSPLEVSVKSLDRHQIAYRLCQPSSKIFRAVERSCMAQLRQGQFPLFKTSDVYANLSRQLQEIKYLKTEEQKQAVDGRLGAGGMPKKPVCSCVIS